MLNFEFMRSAFCRGVLSTQVNLAVPFLHPHAVGELFYGSQPTATTCVRWSRRLKECCWTRVGIGFSNRTGTSVDDGKARGKD